MTLFKKWQFMVALMVCMFALSAPHARAQGTPTYDNISNLLHLKDIGIKLEQLRSAILNLAIVKQILTVNREFTAIQQGISKTIGSVRSAIDTVKGYAQKVMGTINYWKNFDPKKLIPFFDPKTFTSYQEFLNLKDEIKGLGSDVKGFKNLQPGSPFQYATLEAYYTRDWFNQLIEDGQRAAIRGAELGKAEWEIGGLKDVNSFMQATARSAAAGASILNEILSDTIGEGKNMAIINMARAEARRRGDIQILGEEFSTPIY